MSNMYLRILKPVRIVPFTPDMADHVDNDGNVPIYYIQTREGRRMIDPSMYVADKGNGYTHPMAAEVFENDYRPYPEIEPIAYAIGQLSELLMLAGPSSQPLLNEKLEALNETLSRALKLYGVRNA